VPHYAHAPIVEAVIELQCDLPANTTIADLSRICDAIKADYPKKAEIQESTLEVQAGPPPSTNSAQRHVGYKLDSQDDKQIVQIRMLASGTSGSFAFSRLAPYDRWETFRAEGYRLWGKYRDLFNPRIKRVGVRYINRIDIPSSGSGGVNLDDYFLAAPRIPAALPQLMTGYFMRLQVPMNDGVLLVLTQSEAAPPDPSFVSSLLDIDVSVQDENLDEASAWTRIDGLRDDKNMVFEACITNTVRELIN
jgi:uncharacterized protein (TIGR04255 family)